MEVSQHAMLLLHQKDEEAKERERQMAKIMEQKDKVINELSTKIISQSKEIAEIKALLEQMNGRSKELADKTEEDQPANCGTPMRRMTRAASKEEEERKKKKEKKGNQKTGTKREDFPALPKKKRRSSEKRKTATTSTARAKERNLSESDEGEEGELEELIKEQRGPETEGEYDSEPPETEKRKTKLRPPPPITLTEKERFFEVKLFAEEENVCYVARNITDGIKMFFKNEEDFRKMRDFMDTKNCKYFTYQLPSEKELRVVVKGVPEFVKTEDVQQDLLAQGFQIKKVTRMTTTREAEKVKLPMVIINTAKTDEGKKIFNVQEVLTMKVRAESKRRSMRPTQCYRCQQFGHVQFRCTREPRCLRCAGEHMSFQCDKKSKVFPAKCCNCNGGHVASAPICPENPWVKKMEELERRRQRVLEATVEPGVSYARRSSPSTANPQAEEEIGKKDLDSVIMGKISLLIPEIVKNVLLAINGGANNC